MEVRIIGQMDNTIDHTFESANRVYDKNGLCPTIPTCIQPKVIVEDFYANREPRTYGKIAPTIRAEREGLKVIEESRCLAVRYRKYLHRQRGEEENPPHVELGEEGIVNSLTTVQKDNLVMEKNIVIDIYNNKQIDGEVCGTITAHGNASSTTCGTFGIVEKEKINKVGQLSNEGSQCGTVVSDEGLSPTLSAGTHGYANAHVCTEYRIRKLTEKECFRLMGFKDSDFEKARAVNSATQIYKQAGNSIVKQVLMAIFLQMNIQGLKPWNDRNEDEIRELIK